MRHSLTPEEGLLVCFCHHFARVATVPNLLGLKSNKKACISDSIGLRFPHRNLRKPVAPGKSGCADVR